MATNKPSLENAYALETPDDNRRLYAGWATTYDASFAQAMDYQMPGVIAAVFAQVGGGKSPVLDVGAGTGLLAEALPRGLEIDALDISPEMLEVAAGKGVYRQTLLGDLMGQLAIADETYAAIVSAGTFTHGHVGPQALDELIRVAQAGAVFVLGVNAQHFESWGFAAKFDALEPVIRGFETQDVPIYGPGATGEHKDDLVRVVVFSKR
ncbi:MAG: class I SAM-dependent methyltransferase [Pseudomonadota bacterium]